jgi:cobalt-precorrin 5A hydrolase
MRIKILYFTDKGKALAQRLKESLSEHDAVVVPKGVPLAYACGDAFADNEALVFIGAAGIAVRSVAPYLKDKLTDPPVIVIDENGNFVIPVLSGHVGGANSLALGIADVLGAQPVITTATDVSGAFSVDVFAKENGLRITNREGIAKVSSSSLEGKPVTICIKDFPPEGPVDVLIADDAAKGLKDSAKIVLCPKKFAIGMGCRRGKSFDELRAFAEEVLRGNGIDINDAGCIATIDLKKDEEGLKRLSEVWRMPLITFDAGLLAKAEGEFSHSDTVMEKV